MDKRKDCGGMSQCRKCGAELTDKNWYPSQQKNCNNICKACANKQEHEYKHKKGIHEPMSENKECPAFLGVHIAERVLSHVFKNIKRMPYGHKGFDVICNGGYMIDVKSACRRVSEKQADNWLFNINKNTIADYFLCLAFDNRESLNPEHVWLIPGKDVNDKTTIGISETRLEKWDCYKLDKIKEIINCCNILRL